MVSFCDTDQFLDIFTAFATEYRNLPVNDPLWTAGFVVCLGSDAAAAALQMIVKIIPVDMALLEKHFLDLVAALALQLAMAELRLADHLYGIPRGVKLSPIDAIANLVLRDVENPGVKHGTLFHGVRNGVEIFIFLR